MTHLDQAGHGDAGGTRAHPTCGELAEVKKTCRAKSIRRNEEQQYCDSVNPGAHAQPKQKRTRDQPAYLRQEINKPKTVKTKEAKNFTKSEAELVDVMDTLQHAISIIEKEIAKNPGFLQKHIDTRNTNNATVALVNSLQQTVSTMRRTTEQINDQLI